MALSGVGFLSKVVTNVRKWADEPTTSTKFTDAEILEHIRIAWMDVLTEVNRLSTGKTRARFDISVVADQAEYVLPPTIHQFLMFEKINSESGRPEWEVVPNHPLTPSGPGYTIEGPILRLDPVWKEAETMRVTFIPNGEAPLFEATASTWDTTNGDDLTIPASVTDGSVDSRERYSRL